MLVTEHMRIDPAYADRLRACGLDRVERCLAQVDGVVAAWSRTTDTTYVSPTLGAAGFYLKRYYYPRWRNRLRGAFRGTFFGFHRGHAEYLSLSNLRRMGIPAIRPVAYGVRRVGHFVAACFLITEEAPGAPNLTTFARRVVQGGQPLTFAPRRAMTNVLAREVAEMHAAGCEHGQLFWRNILVRNGPQCEPEYFFLDAEPRPLRRLGRGADWWVRELAHLCVSALPLTTRTDRLRFLLRYANARRVTPALRRYAFEIEQLALRWAPHERKRIRMNDLFEAWRAQLALDGGGAAP